MNEMSRESLDAYYAEAASWNRDRVQAMHSSRRVAWWIAGAAVIVAVLEALALVLLVPLKRVEPYTLLVDRTTGHVQALDPLRPETVSPDAALAQSFVVQYVTARESFDLATLNANYRRVALLSAGGARETYLAAMRPESATSPLALYPRSSIVETRVKSVSPMGRTTALVRFDSVRTDEGSSPQLIGSWVAVVRWRWSGAPMKMEDRFVNPLGFQVVGYRKDAEVLPAAPVGSSQTSAARTTTGAAPTPAVTPSTGAPTVLPTEGTQ